MKICAFPVKDLELFLYWLWHKSTLESCASCSLLTVVMFGETAVFSFFLWLSLDVSDNRFPPLFCANLCLQLAQFAHPWLMAAAQLMGRGESFRIAKSVPMGDKQLNLVCFVLSSSLVHCLKKYCFADDFISSVAHNIIDFVSLYL